MTAFPWQLNSSDQAKLDEVFTYLKKRYQGYQDPWGFNLETIERAVKILIPLYRQYFKVRVFGQENIKDIPYIVVSNHSGQIPIDGMLITIAFALDVATPRVLRAMIERFMAGLPFIGDLTAQTGSILGDRANCQYLLDHGESILVFPEGVRGVSKNTNKFYELQSFSQGFYRIALQKKTPVLPVCVIGAEEMYPFVFHAKKLAKMMGIPSLPITPLFPLAGPLGMIPLPSPIDIHIGEAFEIPAELSPDAPDKEIKDQILLIEQRIKNMIKLGLKNRRPFMDQIRKPIERFILKSHGRNV